MSPMTTDASPSREPSSAGLCNCGLQRAYVLLEHELPHELLPRALATSSIKEPIRVAKFLRRRVAVSNNAVSTRLWEVRG